jgi:ketosteroid isomerase-like protein
MDPRVLSVNDHEAVVLWQQRAVSPAGEDLETPVLGVYQVRNGKLARAQMFYFDSAGVNDFLARANSQRTRPNGVQETSGVGGRPM